MPSVPHLQTTSTVSAEKWPPEQSGTFRRGRKIVVGKQSGSNGRPWLSTKFYWIEIPSGHSWQRRHSIGTAASLIGRWSMGNGAASDGEGARADVGAPEGPASGLPVAARELRMRVYACVTSCPATCCVVSCVRACACVCARRVVCVVLDFVACACQCGRVRDCYVALCVMRTWCMLCVPCLA
jgi:hypothetical protein